MLMKSIAVTVCVVVVSVVPAVKAFADKDVGPIKTQGKELVWAGCGVTKTAFMRELAQAYQKKTGVVIKLEGGGATRGIRDVQKNVINMGGACRARMEDDPSERYLDQIPVAWDAIVFIVHKDNPVNDISLSQVRDIFTGNITNWKQVGGSDEPIDLYVRASSLSGVDYVLRELVFNDYDKKFTPRAHVVASTSPAEEAVERTKTAFTATGSSSARRRDVKILNLAGVEPSVANIKKGDYMLFRPLYLITRVGESDPRILNFVKFATSSEGQEVIRATGSIPYTDAMSLMYPHFLHYVNAKSLGDGSGKRIVDGD